MAALTVTIPEEYIHICFFFKVPLLLKGMFHLCYISLLCESPKPLGICQKKGTASEAEHGQRASGFAKSLISTPGTLLSLEAFKL